MNNNNINIMTNNTINIDNTDFHDEYKKWIVRHLRKQQQKEYNKTPFRIKQKKISRWKEQGIIDGDYDSLYNCVNKETHCWICLKQFKSGQDKNVDHDYGITDDNNIRYICCNSCNCHLLAEKYNKDTF